MLSYDKQDDVCDKQDDGCDKQDDSWGHLAFSCNKHDDELDNQVLKWDRHYLVFIWSALS